MRAKILRPFLLSRDGVNAEAQEPGMVTDIPADLHPGLLQERFIEAMEQVDLLEQPLDPPIEDPPAEDEGAEKADADDGLTIPPKAGGEPVAEPTPARRKKAKAA